MPVRPVHCANQTDYLVCTVPVRLCVHCAKMLGKNDNATAFLIVIKFDLNRKKKERGVKVT